MFQKKLFQFVILIVLTVLSTRIEAQILQTTANFEYPDIPITTTPENPGYCNASIGVEVTVNEEFSSYRWTAPLGQTVLFGKTVVLKFSGEWSLRVDYMVNNVACIEERKLYVGDLSNNEGIQEYFENTGFYVVDIYRTAPSLMLECSPDPVSFAAGQSFILLEPVIQSVFDNFKPIAGITPSAKVLSENTCLCTIGIDYLENQFNEGQVAVWAHHFFKNSTDLTGKLFIKGRMPGENSLPIQTQKDHLFDIHSEILTINNGTQEHGRVIFSNLFMPHPIGGYEPSGFCTIPNDLNPNTHFMTPANIAVLLVPNATNFHFTTDATLKEINNGSLYKFDIDDATFQGYIRFDTEIIFNGFYNEKEAQFFESFTSQYGQVACRGECLIYISSVGTACDSDDCSFNTNEYKFNTDNIPMQSILDGGFDLPVDSKVAKFEDYPVSSINAKKFIYDLFCAMKNKDISVTYDPEMNGKIIFAKDIYLGKEYFPVIGIAMPDQGTELFLHYDFSYRNGGINKGFENAIELSPTNVQIRMVYFGNNNDYKNGIIRTSYTKQQWNTWAYKNLISCFHNKGNMTQKYLNPKSDNLLIFVNGYRDNGPTKLDDEYEQSNDEINPCNDNFEGGTYWNEMGRLFVNKINTENTVYADGHHSITTSNHYVSGNNPRASKLHFAAGMCHCLGEAGIRIPSYYPGYSFSPFNCFLDVNPKTDGFYTRYDKGFEAGKDLWSKIQNGKVKIKMNPSKTMITGKIDIVAHSMGFAYALGMTEFLKSKIIADANGYKFGRFYILAPENACSAPPFNLNDFEEVWQYGSNEDEDIDFKQDGIAPQCAVTGLTWDDERYGRVPFLGKSEHRNFLDAHYVENYDWVTKIQIFQRGQVKKRN